MHKKTINLILLSISLCCSLACHAQSPARDYWRLCPADRQLPVRPLYSSDAIEAGSTEVRADSTRIEKDGLTHFSGDVEVIKDSRALFGHVVTYNEASGLFDVEGDAHIWDAGMIWHGEHAAFDLNADTQRLSNGEYWLINGESPKITVHRQPSAEGYLDITEFEGRAIAANLELFESQQAQLSVHRQRVLMLEQQASYLSAVLTECEQTACKDTNDAFIPNVGSSSSRWCTCRRLSRRCESAT